MFQPQKNDIIRIAQAAAVYRYDAVWNLFLYKERLGRSMIAIYLETTNENLCRVIVGDKILYVDVLDIREIKYDKDGKASFYHGTNNYA